MLYQARHEAFYIVLFKNLNHAMRQIILYSIIFTHFADEETKAGRGERTHTSIHLVSGRARICTQVPLIPSCYSRSSQIIQSGGKERQVIRRYLKNQVESRCSGNMCPHYSPP